MKKRRQKRSKKPLTNLFQFKCIFTFIDNKYDGIAIIETLSVANKYFANQDDATQFISEIENVVDNKFVEKQNVLATREFVKEEIAGIKKEISDMRKEAAESKADIIKWMFIFWIGQLAATIGIILLFIRNK